MSRILIIDDDAATRDILRQTFERAGFEVEVAADGNEGIACYRRNPAAVVITDIIMPDREGIETLIEIKGIDPDAKIIAISGGGRTGASDFLALAKKLGAEQVFAKPLDRRALVASVRSMVEGS